MRRQIQRLAPEGKEVDACEIALPHLCEDLDKYHPAVAAAPEPPENQEVACRWEAYATALRHKEAKQQPEVRRAARQGEDDNEAAAPRGGDHRAHSDEPASFCLSGGTLNTHAPCGSAKAPGNVARWGRMPAQVRYGRLACEHLELCSLQAEPFSDACEHALSTGPPSFERPLPSSVPAAEGRVEVWVAGLGLMLWVHACLFLVLVWDVCRLNVFFLVWCWLKVSKQTSRVKVVSFRSFHSFGV